MAVNSFAPTNYASVTAGPSQTVAALPGGGGTVLRVVNFGAQPAVVKLQSGATPPSPEINSNTGVVVTPQEVLYLTVGSNDHIVVKSTGGIGAGTLNLAQGA